MHRSERIALTRAAACFAGLWLALCVTAISQDAAVRLILHIRLEPLVVKAADRLQVTLYVKNDGGRDLLLPAEIEPFRISPYGDIALEYRTAGTQSFNMGPRAYMDPVPSKNLPSPLTLTEMLLSRNFIVLKRESFLGFDRTRTFAYFFDSLPPGRYEVRAKYQGSPNAQLIKDLAAQGIALPNRDQAFFSNIATVEVRPD